MKYKYLHRPSRAVVAVNLIAFFAAIGFLAAIYAVEYNASKGTLSHLTEQQMWQLRINDVLLCFIMIVVGLLTDTLVHECGHALFGLISGMRAKISFKSCLPNSDISSVEIIPKKESGVKGRILFTLSGGLAANFLFIVPGILALAVPQIPVWISGIAVTHIFLFIKNAVPAEFYSGKTDALVMCEIIKNTPEAQVMLAVLSVQAHILNGKSVADCKDTLFNLPQIREDDPSFISLTELRAAYFEATGDKEGAAEQYARFNELKSDYID